MLGRAERKTVHLMTLKQSSARVALTAVACLVVLFSRLRINGESKLRHWDITENYVGLVDGKLSQYMTIGAIHTVYAKLLVWPSVLSYDWSFNVIPVVFNVTDPRNVYTLIVYACLITWVLHGLISKSVTAHVSLIGAAVFVISFLPVRPLLSLSFYIYSLYSLSIASLSLSLSTRREKRVREWYNVPCIVSLVGPTPRYFLWNPL